MAVATPTLTVTRHSTGHMVKLDVTGATGGATVFVYRFVGSETGARSWVRGAYRAPLAAGAATMLDTEPPQGATLVYIAVAVDSGGATAVSAAATLSGTVSLGADYLFDLTAPMTGYPVNVAQFSSLTYNLRNEAVAVLGRRSPLIVSDVRELPRFELRLVTFTQPEAELIRGSLHSSTTFALSPSTPDYGFAGPMYFSPLDVTEGRLSELGRVAARQFTMTCQQVDPPTVQAVVTGAQALSLWATYTGAAPANVNSVRGLGWRTNATFQDLP